MRLLIAALVQAGLIAAVSALTCASFVNKACTNNGCCGDDGGEGIEKCVNGKIVAFNYCPSGTVCTVDLLGSNPQDMCA
jgi:hypothetical protein